MIHVNGGLPLRLARYQCRDKCDRKGHILVSKSARIFVISPTISPIHWANLEIVAALML